MREEVERTAWNDVLRDINAHNFKRPTRLEIIGEIGDVARDYWLEQGAPFLGVSLEVAVADGPRFEIMLGQPEAGGGHLTHNVLQVTSVITERNISGQADVIEFRDGQGNTTILRFETLGATAAAA